MTQRTGDDRPEPLGDRVKLLELAVATIADRTLEIEQLSAATNRLSDSTAGVEDALRAVGEVREKQQEIKQAVDDVAPAVARIEKSIVQRSRIVIIALFVAALIAAAVFSVIDRHGLHGDVNRLQTHLCRIDPTDPTCR